MRKFDKSLLHTHIVVKKKLTENRWHSPYILLYNDPLPTYLLVSEKGPGIYSLCQIFMELLK